MLNGDFSALTADRYSYLVGQIVRARGQFPGRSGKRLYQVVRLLPPADSGPPRYCIRSVLDGVEWVTAQDGIEPAGP
jgi:hypothetical protein